MEKTGVDIGARIHGQWRHMEGVQKYRSTDIQMYRCTNVQCTEKCCYREDGGSWFNKKGPIPFTIENNVKNRWADARRGGNGGE